VGHGSRQLDPNWKAFLRSLRLESEPPAVLADGVKFGTHTTKAPKRVLIVEDNIDAARSAAYLVNDLGHRAEYAINGYAALSLARKLKPQIVLLDLGLPGLDGFEVCRRFKADPELAGVRVVVITGYAGDEFREHAEAAGCDLHLVKPVPAKLLEEILG
jgi:CheY-like chemotaxis protein